MSTRCREKSVIVVSVALLLFVGACGGNQPDAPVGTATGSSSTIPSTTPSTRAPSLPTTPPSPPSNPLPPEPERACDFAGGRSLQESPPSAVKHYVTDATISSDGCSDSVTFHFEPSPDGLPTGFSVEYRDGPFADSSDRVTEVAGSKFLVVHFRRAAIARIDPSGVVDTFTAPRSVVPEVDTVGVREVALYGAFEGHVRFVIGLDSVRPFRITPGNDSFVVHIGPMSQPPT